MAKTLVVYYSQSRGNTKKIAREIASTLGADLAAIDTVQPYNCSYDELVYGLSKTETQNKVCPPIKPLDKDPAYYDRIVLGTPTWWYTMAPAVHFLNRNRSDWQRVGPVCHPRRLGRKAEITSHTKTTRRLCRRVLFYGGYLAAGLL